MRFLSFCRSSALSPLRVAQFRFFHFPLVGEKLLYSASYGRYVSPGFDTESAKSMETNRSCRFVADHPFSASAKGKLFPWRAHAKESVSWLLAPTTSSGAPDRLVEHYTWILRLYSISTNGPSTDLTAHSGADHLLTHFVDGCLLRNHRRWPASFRGANPRLMDEPSRDYYDVSSFLADCLKYIINLTKCK